MRNLIKNKDIAKAIEAFIECDFSMKEASRKTGIPYSRISYILSKHYLYKRGENVIVLQSKV